MILSGRKVTPSFAEFVTLTATMISLVALSIDAMLPALPEIARDLGVQGANDRQLIISILFLGMAFGQLFYGPLSDKTGRKPAIYAGFGLFIVGCLLSMVAANFSLMLAGRLLQGFGVAGPRAVAVALVRDQYEGEAMARVMSFVMAVFILVPMIAPAFGQAILLVANWRAIFGSFLILAVITLVWFAFRQPETLDIAARKPLSLRRVAAAGREIVSSRTAFGYTLAAGLIGGAFLGYLNSAQQIFQDKYGVAERFPLYFATVALSIGAASFLNAHLVMRYGMRALSRWALFAISGLAIVALGTVAVFGSPPLWGLLTYLMTSFFCIGILFGNLNALAMEPLGHIAGIGAAVVGSVSTLLSVPLGTAIGLSYNGTIVPLVAGLAVLSISSIFVMRWTESGGDKVASSPRVPKH